jgi:hypothetical protein
MIETVAKSHSVRAPKQNWRIIVIGGHTRSIGKTQLVCDVIRAFPDAQWIAGKITQYGHGVCAKNGENCGCAPDEHSYAINWERKSDTGTDSSRFLAAGAKRSFWLRTKQGFLAEGLPLLRALLSETTESNETTESSETTEASGTSETTETSETAELIAGEAPTLIVESNSLLQFVQPSLYFAVMDSSREDFKESARVVLDRADALVLHSGGEASSPESPEWLKLPTQLLQKVPSIRQLEGEPLPLPLQILVRRILEGPADVAL